MLAELVVTPWHWAGFIGCVVFLLALDLGVFHKAAHEVRFREALGWTILWFTLAMCFAGLLLRVSTPEKATLFVTGYIVELSLSMDNVFVIAVIFRYFQVPVRFQHRVLFWGILGALVMRGVMIAGGVALIHHFEWMLLVLGAFLIFTGVRMFFGVNEDVELERNFVLRLTRRFFRVTPEFHGQKFVLRRPDGLVLTPLAIVLLMVETTDLIFALDSIPAIFGITTDPFIIFTSNVFAILGLRSLYFVLAGAIGYFTYLKFGLSAVLVFIGVKMVGQPWFKIPTNLSLLIVLAIILTSIGLSVAVAGFRKSVADRERRRS